MTGLPLGIAFLAGFSSSYAFGALLFRGFLDFFGAWLGEFEFRATKHVSQVGADSLALAVGVARQIDGVSSRGGFLQVGDDLGLAGADLIGRRETVLDVYAQLLLGQVHHMPVGSLHGIVSPEIFIDGLRLRGRFDDNQRSCHVCFLNRNAFQKEALQPFLLLAWPSYPCFVNA